MVIHLDDKQNGLWQGGPWEQPAPSFPVPPPVVIPTSRPVLRARRRRRRWPFVVGGLLAFLLIGLLLAVLSGLFPFQPIQFPPYGPPAASDPAQAQEYSTHPPTIPQAPTGTGVTLELLPAGDAALTYSQIYKANAPSIVSINAASGQEYSTGTGVVLTRDGYIVTNAHVVAGADLVQVVFSDNHALEASLVGFDAAEDLAVLKVDGKDLTPARFGDSGLLEQGDPVAAIGDPLGYRSTITDGIVSALDREVTVDGVTMILIQTSAAINFGNSGGALINQYGQVVGITTVKIVTQDGSAEALGFAIPSQRVKYVVDRLIAGEEIRTGVFGITVSTQPVEGGGLSIIHVEPNSDAQAKGILPGDVILSVNGQPIAGTQDLVRAKLALGPGDPVTLTCRRDGVPYTVEVLLIDAEAVSD